MSFVCTEILLYMHEFYHSDGQVAFEYISVKHETGRQQQLLIMK